MCSIENDWVANFSWLRQYSQHALARAATAFRVAVDTASLRGGSVYTKGIHDFAE